MASKITIKRSLTAAAPAGLSFGEMAFVQGSGLTANQLYVGISGGSPAWVGAQIGTTGTWTDTAAQTSLATQYAIEQRIGAKITASTTGVSSVNGATGAVVNVALTTNSLSQFAATTSSQLLGVISDETGTGSLVFATSPTLVTPALGTPSALVGTNITGTASGLTAGNVTTNANLTGHITSTGNAAVLGSFTSLQLRTALSDDTGTGVAVFQKDPTFDTSVVGSATMAVFNTASTTVNGFGAATTMTLGGTSGTAAIRNPTLTLGNTTNTISTNSGTVNVLTLAPYGSLLLTAQSTSVVGGEFPSISIENTDNAAGNVNINGGNLRLSTKQNAATIVTPVNIIFEGATDNANDTTLTVTDPTANRTITLPDATGTVALTATSVASFNGATGAVTGVSSFNGLTGAVSGLTSGGPLGTPASGTLTNCTGLPVGTGISGLGTNVPAFLATPSSANLAAALTDETGSGSAVFASSPTLVTPTLGVAAATSINKVTITTPATGSTLTILDGKTLAVNNTLTFTGTDASSVAFGAGGTVVYTSGLGTGVATFLATPSSANLISAITDETGTGSLVFASSPTLVTPTLGVAAATSINKVTITTPATGSTITVADGKTLTASNTLTFTGTDASSVAFGTGGTVVYTSGLGTNVAAFLATPSSANLISAITDETGTGALVFANTPTLVTPNIGAATGTSLVLSGDLTVNGTTTTINSTTLTVDDKNIELGSVASPTDITADGGGITLRGTTPKTLNWVNSGALAWTSSENFNLLTGKAYYIDGASVLNATTLGSAIVTSSLTSVGTLTSLTVSGTLEAGLIDCGTF